MKTESKIAVHLSIQCACSYSATSQLEIQTALMRFYRTDLIRQGNLSICMIPLKYLNTNPNCNNFMEILNK